jgi:hypothetical protein
VVIIERLIDGDIWGAIIAWIPRQRTTTKSAEAKATERKEKYLVYESNSTMMIVKTILAE